MAKQENKQEQVEELETVEETIEETTEQTDSPPDENETKIAELEAMVSEWEDKYKRLYAPRQQLPQRAPIFKILAFTTLI